jgi:PKD repeat protein
MCRNGHIFQYDLNSTNIEISVYTIDLYKETEFQRSGFAYMQLNDKGRIYMDEGYSLFKNGGPSGSTWHSINFPNRKSKNCTILRNILAVGKSKGNLGTPPYFPNYRLGPIDGSPCDTLGFDNHPLSQWHWDVEDIDNEPFKVTFTDNSFYEPSNWHWNFNGLGVSQDTSPVFTFPGVGTYPVCLIVCNQYSCDTLCRDVTLGYAPPPVYASASFELPSDSACLNQFITFQTIDSGAIEYRWNFSVNALPQQYVYGSGPHQVKFSTLGSQTILLEAANLVSYDTLSQIIQIVPLAVANYTQVKSGNTVVFTNTSFLGISYLWDFGDGTTSTEVSPTHIFQNDGLYIVKLTVFGQCNTVFKSKELSITIVGVEELNKLPITIDIYLNPVNDMLYLSTSDFNLNNLGYEISNVMGQSLQKGRFIGTNPQINTSDFAPNHYFLKIFR